MGGFQDSEMNDHMLIEYIPGHSIRLIIPVPPSANRYWRHGNNRTYRSSEAGAYIESLQWKIKEWGIEPLAGRLKFEAVYSIRASRDLGNNGKVLQDALQGVCYANDGQIDEIHEYRQPFKNGGAVFVVVSVVESCMKVK